MNIFHADNHSINCFFCNRITVQVQYITVETCKMQVKAQFLQFYINLVYFCQAKQMILFLNRSDFRFGRKTAPGVNLLDLFHGELSFKWMAPEDSFTIYSLKPQGKRCLIFIFKGCIDWSILPAASTNSYALPNNIVPGWILVK